MLFECNSALYVWSIFTIVTGIRLSWNDIVFGKGTKHYDEIATLLAYFLYKAWIMEISGKCIANFRHLLANELKLKKELYNIIGYHDVAVTLTKISDMLDW